MNVYVKSLYGHMFLFPAGKYLGLQKYAIWLKIFVNYPQVIILLSSN